MWYSYLEYFFNISCSHIWWKVTEILWYGFLSKYMIWLKCSSEISLIFYKHSTELIFKNMQKVVHKYQVLIINAFELSLSTSTMILKERRRIKLFQFSRAHHLDCNLKTFFTSINGRTRKALNRDFNIYLYLMNSQMGQCNFLQPLKSNPENW